MLSQLFKMRRKLAIKLTLLVSCAIIPVNILAVLLTGINVTEFQNRLIESYRSEMRLYMAQIDARLQEIEDSAAVYISNNILGLSIGFDEERRQIEVISLFNRLRESKGRLKLASMAYLKDNSTGEVMITLGSLLTGDPVPPEFIDKTIAVLSRLDLSAVPAVQYSPLIIDEQIFQLNNYFFRQYSFGFVIDSQQILKGSSAMRQSDSEIFYLAADDGRLIASFDAADDIRILGDGSDMSRVSWLETEFRDSLIMTESEKMPYRLIRVLDRNDLAASIPFTDRLLQFVAFVSFLLIPLTWLLIRYHVLKPLQLLSGAMHVIEKGNLDYRIRTTANTDDFQYMFDSFNRMAGEIKSLTIESYEKDIERLQTEAVNLRLQVNPHLLLNSFNMIYNLAQSKNFRSIQDFSLHLADYFRYALKQNDKLVPLEAEMKFVLSFLEVQKIRFPGAFTSVYSIDDGLEKVPVPPLLVENFVENSIKYGLKLGSTIEIIIIIRRQENRLLISICDTGNGVEPDVLEQLRQGNIVEDRTGQHIGIWNCRRRLKLFYGEKATLNITSSIGEGTQIWIELPIDPKFNDQNLNRKDDLA